MGYRKVPPAQCACGCGQWITRMMHNGRIRTHKPGHHKVKDGKPKRSEIFKCKGCEYTGHRNGRKSYCSQECYWRHVGYDFKPKSERKRSGGKFVDRSDFKVCSSPRIQRIYMLAACEGKCEECGWGKIEEVLEVHHKNRDKKDGRRENLILLCPNCHEIAHFLEKTGRYDPNRYNRAQEKANKFLGMEQHAIFAG